ncbi:MAG: hypothetical protein DRI61_11060 [Chloroflexi bacterium]|nr:MAG: hypothetical protein DRI61_11060 [Chloroflexota bacterium]
MRRRTVDEIRQLIIPVLKKHNVARAAVFGSVATGKAGEKSDVDLLVEFRGRKSLLDLVALKLELEETLGSEVDVLTFKSLHPKLRRRILGEAITIYGFCPQSPGISTGP